MRAKATAEEMMEFIIREGQEKRFEAWVKSYRAEQDLRKLNENIDASEKAFNEYMELMKKTNEEKDPKKKSVLRWQAIEAYAKYQKIDAEYKSLQARVDKNLGLK